MKSKKSTQFCNGNGVFAFPMYHYIFVLIITNFSRYHLSSICNCEVGTRCLNPSAMTALLIAPHDAFQVSHFHTRESQLYCTPHICQSLSRHRNLSFESVSSVNRLVDTRGHTDKTRSNHTPRLCFLCFWVSTPTEVANSPSNSRLRPETL